MRNFKGSVWHGGCTLRKEMKFSKNKTSCEFDCVGFVARKSEQVVFNVSAFCLGVSMNNM